jgi:hypothetical protein
MSLLGSSPASARHQPRHQSYTPDFTVPFLPFFLFG